MKLLLDENFSDRITQRIVDFYPDSVRLKTLGLTNTDDAESLVSLEREKQRVYWYCRSMKPKDQKLRNYQIKEFTAWKKISSKLS